MNVAIVTDSNAQLPAALAQRYGIRTVPLGITIDGEPYLEGVNLTNDVFYARLADGASVATSAPAPGSILAIYEAAAAAGSDRVLSIHVGANTSGTLNAVAVAAKLSPIPVEIVDTGTASFAIGCCVWGAAEAIALGASVEAARERAEEIARSIGNVFVVGAVHLAARGGRLANDLTETPSSVLALEDGRMRVVAQVGDGSSATDAMVRYVLDHARGRPLRIGVGNAGVDELATELVGALDASGVATEVVRYEIGPSVGAHTGFGTYGCVFFPS